MSFTGDAIDISVFRRGDPCPVGCGGELRHFATWDDDGVTFLCSGCGWSPWWPSETGNSNSLTAHQAIAARRRHEARQVPA